MSSAGTVTVDITARTAQLRAELAIAKAELSKFSGEVKSLSSAMVSAGAQGDAALGSALNSAVRDAAAASQRVSGLTRELKAVEPAARAMHGSISTATREFRALFDEVSSGRTRMIPGTLAIIGQRVLGLGPAALGAVAGVGILVAALGYLVIKGMEAANAIERIHLGGLGTQGFVATEDQIKHLIQTLDALPDVSSKDAEKIVGIFSQMENRSEATFTGLSAATIAWANLSNQSYDKAGEGLAKVFGEPASAQAKKFMTDLRGVSTEEIKAYDDARTAGDAYGMQKAMMEALNNTIKNSRQELIAHAAANHTSWRNTAEWILLIQGGMQPEEADNAILAEKTAQYDKLSAAIQGAVASMKQQQQTPLQKFTDVVNEGDQINHTRVEIDKLTAYIKKAKAELNTPEGKTAFARISQDVHEAEEQLKSLQNKQQFKGTGFSNAGQELIAQAKESISAINANEAIGGKQRVALVQETYAELLKSAKLNKAQRLEVETALNKDIAAANKATAAEVAKDKRADVQTDLEISRLQLQAKRDELDQEVAEGKKTRQQELAELASFARDELKINLEVIDASVAGYDKDSEAFKEAERRKRIERERTRLELEKIDLEIAQADKKTAKNDADNWKGAVNEIVGAETRFEDDLLSGRKTFTQSLYGLTSSLIKKEIEQDTAYYTRKLLLGEQAFAEDKEQETGGFLVHLLTENKKTAATVTGEAARTTAKTAASAAGKAAEATEGAATISKDAAKAAAGAYSAVAGIPIVGPILAPIAAGTAFAAVMAYESLASLDVGAWNVPRDMPAMIHKGETVVPKNFAQGLRESGGAFGGNHNTTTNNTVHLNYQPQVQNNPNKSLEDHLESDGHVMRRWLMNQVRNGSLRF